MYIRGSPHAHYNGAQQLQLGVANIKQSLEGQNA